MSDNLMSRRKFLVSAGTVAAAAGIAGVGLAKVAAPAAAEGTATPWPYPTEVPPSNPIPRHWLAAHTSSTTPGGCAEATWWPIVEALGRAANPTTWATLAEEDLHLRRRRRGRLGHAVRHLQRLCRHRRHGRL